MERNIAIMIGSIPQCRPLVMPFASFANRTFSKMTGSRSSGSKGGSYAMSDRKRTDGTGGSERTARSAGTQEFVRTEEFANKSVGSDYNVEVGREQSRASGGSRENILPVVGREAV